jgi:WW domain
MAPRDAQLQDNFNAMLQAYPELSAGRSAHMVMALYNADKAAAELQAQRRADAQWLARPAARSAALTIEKAWLQYKRGWAGVYRAALVQRLRELDSSSSVGSSSSAPALAWEERALTLAQWAEVSDDSGQVYYLNSSTGESSWTLPDADAITATATADDDDYGQLVVASSSSELPAGWEQAYDGDMPYYYNTSTGESSWTRPEQEQQQ